MRGPHNVSPAGFSVRLKRGSESQDRNHSVPGKVAVRLPRNLFSPGVEPVLLVAAPAPFFVISNVESSAFRLLVQTRTMTQTKTLWVFDHVERRQPPVVVQADDQTAAWAVFRSFAADPTLGFLVVDKDWSCVEADAAN